MSGVLLFDEDQEDLTPRFKEVLAEVFKRFDVDGDGALNREELSMCRIHLRKNLSDSGSNGCVQTLLLLFAMAHHLMKILSSKSSLLRPIPTITCC